jgi:DNA polymerase III subunit beta
MKFECTTEKLKEAIQKVEKITQRNSTLPILSCVLLEATKNTLVVKSTNLDLGIEFSIPIKTETEGFVAVPANVFSQFLVNTINEKSIKIYLKEGSLYLETEKSKTNIKTFSIDDFPIIPRVEDGKEFDIDVRDFVKGLKSVWYSASISSIKPELSSVYVYEDSQEIIFVATDSFRLAEKRVKCKKVVDMTAILIPNKNIGEIIRVLDGITEDITMTVSSNQIVFTSPSLYLTSRVVDGNFPDYKQIIPKEFTTNVVVLKADLINSLKSTNVFLDSFNQVRFLIEPKSKKIELSAKNGDVGQNVVSFGAVLEGQDVSVGFNYKYLSDCFQSIDSDSVSLDFCGPNRPLVIKGISDNSFLYLVMPMNR